MKTKIIIYKNDEFYFPGTLDKTIKFFQDLKEQVPDEFEDEVVFDVYATTTYDSTMIEISVYYYREETEEESYKRIQFEKEKEQRQRENDLQKLKELKELYPDD